MIKNKKRILTKLRLPKLLPQDYRKITEYTLRRPMIPAILLIIFLLLSYLIPQDKNFQKARTAILKNKQDYSAHLQLANKFIEDNDFRRAQRELKFLKVREKKLNEEQKNQLRKCQARYNQSTKRGVEKLIKSWQAMLKKRPRYKTGWLYLAYYQAKLNLKNEARQSLKKAWEIDPGLPIEAIKKSLLLN